MRTEEEIREKKKLLESSLKSNERDYPNSDSLLNFFKDRIDALNWVLNDKESGE